MNLMETMTCLALSSGWPVAPEMGAEQVDAPACVLADLDLAGRLEHVRPDPGLATNFSLQRARAELGLVTAQNISGRVAIDARRSAPDSGYLGLEGESWFMRAQIVEARVASARLGLTVAGGLIDDPWVVSGNQAFGYRSLAATQSEALGFSDRSDLGGSLTWTAPHKRVRITATLLTGEGLARRERNNGKDLHGLVEVRPWNDEQLVISLYGKDGSRGVLKARNHRAGARVHGLVPSLGPTDAITYGVAVTKAWGVDGDPDRTPFGGEGWVSADLDLITALVRTSFVDQAPGTEQTTDGSVLAAVGIRAQGQPDSLQHRPAHLVLGVDRRFVGLNSAGIAGGAGTTSTTTLFVQIGVNLRVVAPTSMWGTARGDL